MTTTIQETRSIHFLKGTELFSLGSNFYRTIGKKITSLGGVSITNTDTVQHIAEGKHFEYVTGSQTLTVGIDVNGRVWTCGNQKKALGRYAPSDNDQRIFAPVLTQPERMVKVQASGRSIVALGESGRLYGIGKNEFNIFGMLQYYNGDWFEEFIPILTNFRFKDITLAPHNLYGITDEGDIYGWGCTTGNALTYNPQGYSRGGVNYGDTRISDGVMKFKAITGGLHTLLALREDGQLAALGSTAKKFITNTNTSSALKKLTISDHKNFNFEKIYLNNNAFFGIKADGSLWVGGGASRNLEGLNNVSRSGRLVRLGNKRWDQLSPRESGMYGLQKDGSLWTWGSSLVSLNFTKDSETGVIYAPTKVEHITGVTKLKGNMEEAVFDEFENMYADQKIDITLRNRGLGIIPVISNSDKVLETRYLFKEISSGENYRYLKFNGSAFVTINASPEEAFEQGHTLAYIKEKELSILTRINARSNKRLYIVALAKLKGATNDYFFKELRQTINESSVHDGTSFNSRIFFPGHSKSVINKELLEFESK